MAFLIKFYLAKKRGRKTLLFLDPSTIGFQFSLVFSTALVNVERIATPSTGPPSGPAWLAAAEASRRESGLCV